MKVLDTLVVVLFALVAVAPTTVVIRGTITDSMCATADHKPMRMGPTDAECATACVEEHDARFVLYDGKQAYELSDQRTAEKFAGQKVRVTGTKNDKTKTIEVKAIAAAK